MSTRDYYDDFSRGYETERHGGYHALIDDLEAEVLLPYVRGANVLEIGCGTGLLLNRVAKHARRVRGIDLSAGMLAPSVERGFEVCQASATALPFADNTFDLAYSFKVLAHIPELPKALSEAYRVIRRGGHVVAELYNPLSLRYLAKRIAGPQPISEGRTEADVYTRWHAPWEVSALLPAGAEVVATRGVRVFTPAAFVHRIPGVAGLLRRAEGAAVTSPLRHFGGFYIVVFRKPG